MLFGKAECFLTFMSFLMSFMTMELCSKCGPFDFKSLGSHSEWQPKLSTGCKPISLNSLNGQLDMFLFSFVLKIQRIHLDVGLFGCFLCCWHVGMSRDRSTDDTCIFDFCYGMKTRSEMYQSMLRVLDIVRVLTASWNMQTLFLFILPAPQLLSMVLYRTGKIWKKSSCIWKGSEYCPLTC